MRVLVVGLGAIAQRHIANLKALAPDCEIACWRQRPDPAGWRPPEGLPVDRWLRDCCDVVAWAPEGAIVANPASLHVRTGLFLAGMGAHLFIEKPIGTGDEESLLGGTPPIAGLIRECDRRGLVLMVGYDFRFFEPFQAVKEALDAGRIGRPLHLRCQVGQYLPDWRPGRDYRTSVSARSELGGGVLLELSHEIDYARWLMGEVAAVSAQVGRLSDLEIDVEDTADLLLRFESGAMGSVHLDMTDRAGIRGCRIVGTEGTLACDIRTGRVDHFYPRSESADAKVGIVLPERPKAGDLLWDILHEGLTVIPDPLLEEMRHFLACCRGETVPPVGGEEGRRVLEIVLAARRSTEERREVEV